MPIIRRGEDEELELQMTPMIDVVFLLLIFFMCTTKFQLENELDLNLPPERQDDVASLSVPIKIEITAKGDILFDGVKTGQRRLARVLASLNSSRREGDLPVAIYGDPEARHRDIVRVLDACGMAGVWNVSVATFGEE